MNGALIAVNEEKLGYAMVKGQLLSEKKLQTALDFQRSLGGTLIDIMTRLGFIEPHVLASFLTDLRQTDAVPPPAEGEARGTDDETDAGESPIKFPADDEPAEDREPPEKPAPAKAPPPKAGLRKSAERPGSGAGPEKVRKDTRIMSSGEGEDADRAEDDVATKAVLPEKPEPPPPAGRPSVWERRYVDPVLGGLIRLLIQKNLIKSEDLDRIITA